MLIAMTGKKRSGKDTVASMIKADYGCEPVAFAGPLKGMIKFLLLAAGMTEEQADARINGTEAEKEEPLPVLQHKSARFAMQKLGTEWRNFLGKDLWTDIIKSKVQNTDRVVLTDMRFLHEADFVDIYEGSKVRVVRPGTNTGDTHPSETEMDKIVPDYTIYNHGSLEQLYAATSRMMFAVSGARGLI
jgi:hypothetical protein